MSLRLCIIKPLKSGHPYNKDSLEMSHSVPIRGVPLYFPYRHTSSVSCESGVSVVGDFKGNTGPTTNEGPTTLLFCLLGRGGRF